MSLGNIFNAPSIGPASTQIRMGHETNILVRATQVVVDDRVRQYSISDRKCRFTDEIKADSLFNFYTQDLCMYQCR